jgi:hypothetical protein
MRRIKIAGLCLVAMFAMSAIVTGTASAVAPEFGQCIKKAKAEGTGFSDSKCTKEGTGTKAKYEWQAGFKSGENEFTSSGGTATLLTVKGESVTCSSESSTGTYKLGGNNKEEETTVTFKGCKSNGLTCTTAGKSPGELVTNPLTGIVGFEKSTSTKKTVLQLHPTTSGGHFIDFKCTEALTIEVRGNNANGGILAPIKNGKMTATESLKYKAAKGIQKPSSWVPPAGFTAEQFLESNFQGTGFAKSGQTITSTVTNVGGVKYELNTVV